MLKKHRGFLIFLFVAEAICLVIFACQAANMASNPETVDFVLDEMISDFGYYEDCWYIDEELLGMDQTVDFLRGPYMELAKGSYTLHIAYECESEQVFYAYAEDEEGTLVRASETKLNNQKNELNYRFNVLDDVENFEVVVTYDGTGEFSIYDIGLTANADWAMRKVVALTALFMMLDAFLLTQWTRQKMLVVLSLTGITVAASLPLLVKGLVRGDDIRFHLMRIDSIAEGLRYGQFPVKLNWLYLEGYGYPASVFYGDLLLYLPAVLRLCGFTIVGAYKIFVIFVNVCTAWLSYYCFEKMFRSRKIAAIVAFVYLVSNNHLEGLFIHAAVGQYSAPMFLPVVALAVYQLYTQNAKKRNSYCRWAIVLALGMSGLLATHILTTQITVFVLALICLILCKKTFQKDVLFAYFLAVGLTVLFSLHFLVPFTDYFLTVDVNVNSGTANAIPHIQQYGVPLKKIFTLWTISEDGFIYLGKETPGLLLILALIIAVITCFLRKATPEIWLITLFSLFVLFMSTTLFPWDAWADVSHLARFLAKAQFPSRYLVVAILFLTILFGMLLKQLNTRKVWLYSCLALSAAFCIAVSVFFTCTYAQDATIYYYYDTPQQKTISIGFGEEYLRTGASIYGLDGELKAEGLSTVEMVAREGTRMEIFCQAGETDGNVDIPMFHYKGYQALDEQGNRLQITDGNNQVMRLSIPAGYEGNVTVDFVQPWYWRAAQIISLLSWIGLAAYAIRRKKEIN